MLKKEIDSVGRWVKCVACEPHRIAVQVKLSHRITDDAQSKNGDYSDCSNLAKYAKGHTFKYLEQPKKRRGGSRAFRVLKKDIKTKAVLETYDSTKDAVRAAGSTSILHCLSGDIDSSVGYIWEYERPENK